MPRAPYEDAPRLPPVVAFLLVIAALYFARDIFVPLSVAVLFSFLLTPAVRWLERWKIARLPSVMMLFLFFFTCGAGVAYLVGNQLFEMLNQCRRTRTTRTKMDSRTPWGSLAKVTASVEELSKELAAPKPQDVSEAPRSPSPTQKAATAAPKDAKPLPVEIVEPPPNAMQSVRNIAGPLLAPVGGAVVVVIFTIVILIKREDLRNRVLRLLGRGRLPRTTQAFDDAAERVTRYLRMQFLVNTTFGVLIGLGLYFIGLPSALLWGPSRTSSLHALSRPHRGGSLPTLVALAVFPGWCIQRCVSACS